MKRILALWLLVVAVSAAAYTQTSLADVKTGGSKSIMVDGKYQVWTKKVGDGKIKVLLLHGGPGFTHEYFECFEDFLPKEGIEFYYYDQLGSGFSDVPTDTNLWQVDRFREEVEQVRKGLGLENFYLYGHSWGAMLAMEYSFKYQQHLKGLILSDMTASVESYNAYASKLRSQLPADVIAVLDKYEKTKDYEAPEYFETMLKNVYSQYVCRLDPWPEPVGRAFKHMNPQVYNTMQGPNEFVIIGNFSKWTAWDRLPSISVPTLCMGAVHDEMNPDDIRREGKLIPHSRTFIANGSHLAMWDDQENYFAALVKFLKDVEGGKF